MGTTYCVKATGTCEENRCNICPQGYEPEGPKRVTSVSAPGPIIKVDPEQLPLFAYDDDDYSQQQPQQRDQQQHKSDGGPTDYYKFLSDEVDLSDVIERLNMPFSRANIFKACMRLGQKDGTAIMYDLNKMEFFIQRMKKAHKKGYRV